MSGGFCPSCGTPRTGERFCGTCGNDFSKSPAGQAPGTPVFSASGEPAPAARATRGSAMLLWLILVPMAIGAVLVGFLTKLDVWGFVIGGLLGGALGAWIQRQYMASSNYENLRRMGRK
jgi:hypothetical protein